MSATITEELLCSICGQNKRSQEQENLSFVRDIMKKIKDGEPHLHQFITATAASQADEFINNTAETLSECDRADISEEDVLTTMFVAAMCMVAQTFMQRDEANELKDLLG
jgi:hypothetical protein